MLLAVDVGNTHMVIGIYQGREIRCHWRVKTDKGNTVDEIAAIFHGLFAMEEIFFNEISAIIISSVVPAMQSAWSLFARQYLHLDPLLVGRNVTVDMPVLLDNPQEVGADRLVNSIAGFDQYAAALIIADFGTAITLDCVSAKGEYLGGVIAPGLSISLEALANRTAKLPQIDISIPPAKTIGTNTGDAIRSGILFGYGGMIDGLVSRIKKELLPDIPKVIATGGMAGLIAPYSEAIEAVDPMLTLKGLQLLHERNR
jgi:type III pantothenate kinase